MTTPQLFTFAICIFHWTTVYAQCRYMEYAGFVHPIDICAISYDHSENNQTSWKSISFACKQNYQDHLDSYTVDDDSYTVVATYYSKLNCNGEEMFHGTYKDTGYNCEGSSSECSLVNYGIIPCEYSAVAVEHILVADICPYYGYKMSCGGSTGPHFYKCEDQTVTGSAVSYVNGNLCGYGTGSCYDGSVGDSDGELVLKEKETMKVSLVVIIIIIVSVIMVFITVSVIIYKRRKKLKQVKEVPAEINPISKQTEFKKGHTDDTTNKDNVTGGEDLELGLPAYNNVDIAPSAPMEEPGSIPMLMADNTNNYETGDKAYVSPAFSANYNADNLNRTETTGEEGGGYIVNDKYSDIKNFFYNKVCIDEYNEKYIGLMIENGFDTLEIMKTLTNQNLIDIGVDKLGHRNKILAEVKQLN